jgi:hypothetical protein
LSPVVAHCGLRSVDAAESPDPAECFAGATAKQPYTWLTDDGPASASRLRILRHPGRALGVAPSRGAAQHAEIDADLAERLRALGYLNAGAVAPDAEVESPAPGLDEFEQKTKAVEIVFSTSPAE